MFEKEKETTKAMQCLSVCNIISIPRGCNKANLKILMTNFKTLYFHCLPSLVSQSLLNQRKS